MSDTPEMVQWRNIRKVVKELADLCFGSPTTVGQVSLASAHVALTTSLTAKDGLNTTLEPLPTTPPAPAPMPEPVAWIVEVQKRVGGPWFPQFPARATKSDADIDMAMFKTPCKRVTPLYAGAVPAAPKGSASEAATEPKPHGEVVISTSLLGMDGVQVIKWAEDAPPLQVGMPVYLGVSPLAAAQASRKEALARGLKELENDRTYLIDATPSVGAVGAVPEATKGEQP